METKKRTLARMVSYRITAWLFTIFYTWLFTGSIGAATGFATILHILLSIDYYVHERIWLKIRWGLKQLDYRNFNVPIPDKIDRLDGAFYMRAEWQLCRVVWPHRCLISGRRLWPGTLAYRGRAVWHGPGEALIEEHWHDRLEHLIFQLKE